MTGKTAWTNWIVALFGLWILATPFFMTGSVDSGTAMWSNVISGLVVLVLAGWNGYEAQQAAA